MHTTASRLRNVALVGHRGSGKTSVFEALLFEAGAISRMGSVVEGTTVSDSAPDERARGMSISSAFASFPWQERKINLVDAPGDPSFVADALAALRVCENAIFVVNGVNGFEVGAERLWRRADELGRARLVFVNMLDRERADFFRTLEQLKTKIGPHAVATEIPIGDGPGIRGVVDLIDMCAYAYDGGGTTEIPVPDEVRGLAETYRERLMEEVAEVSDELMERYLDGEDISHAETVDALKSGVCAGRIFPVTCGVATANLAIDRLLAAIIEDLPSPAMAGPVQVGEETLVPEDDAEAVAFVFKTLADPFAGRVNLFRVLQGTVRPDAPLSNTRTHTKERLGQLLVPQGKETRHADELGPGDIGAVAKLKETHAGDVLAARDHELSIDLPAAPVPVMAFAVAPAHSGDEDRVATALRRLQEEDPAIDVHRDPETGELIVAGLSQVHVEVIVGRMAERFGVEVVLRPPRVPYRETIKCGASAHARYKKQTGGRGQFADCRIEIEPLDHDADLAFANTIRGGAIPSGFIPAVEKGVQEAMAEGVVAGYPVRGVGVRLCDGAFHRVDSSEMAFKIAGSMAFRQAMEQADPVLLEPIMTVTVSIPEDSVGDVIGDLNGRRGHPVGMEPNGSQTELHAEVPMAEMLSYAPDLRSITGGRGEYAMEFLRYAEVPAHIAQRVVADAV